MSILHQEIVEVLQYNTTRFLDNSKNELSLHQQKQPNQEREDEPDGCDLLKN